MSELQERLQECANSRNQTLDLSNFELPKIQPAGFRLPGRQLSTLIPELWAVPQLGQLTSLDLSGNGLSSLPPQLGQLVSLTALNLSYNQLSTLPLEVWDLVRLTKLDLSHNYLYPLATHSHLRSALEGSTPFDINFTFPDKMVQLKQLTHLNLSYNRLLVIPDNLLHLTQLTHLNLAHNELSTLPDKLLQLTQLTHLILAFNELSTLPIPLGALKQLTHLDLTMNLLLNLNKSTLPTKYWELKNLFRLSLSYTQLETFPSELGQLVHLTELNISGNQVVALPPELGNLTELTVLDLSVNSLVTLPAELSELVKLKVLNVCGNTTFSILHGVFKLDHSLPRTRNTRKLEITHPLSRMHCHSRYCERPTHPELGRLSAFPPELQRLTELTQLDLSGNQLCMIPSLETFGQLTLLDLSGNQLSTFSAQLGNLTYLDLSHNELSTFSAQLENLTSLDLSHNQLSTFSAQLGNLTYLDLSHNELSTFSAQLENLTSLDPSHNQLRTLSTQLEILTYLDLSHNQLRTLPVELRRLIQLTELDASHNQLTTILRELRELTMLSNLNLSSNQLTAVPPELGLLTTLQTLNLSSNQLTAVPPELGLLTTLQTLNLSSNQLTAVPPELGQLTALEELNLSSNQLTAVPPELGQLTELFSCCLSNNPKLLYPPPEVASLAPQETALFLRHANANTALPARRAKALIMGAGGVGKTSLIARLRSPSNGLTDDPMTNGIQVVLWSPATSSDDDPMSNSSISIWDFGGQEIYLNSHQFFMSDRCVNVIVWRGRERSQDDATRWLAQLSARVPHSRVIVVATRSDEAVGEPLTIIATNVHGLPESIATLHVNPEQIWVSSKSGEHVDDFRTLLLGELQSLPLFGALYPADWLAVADKLHGMRDEYRHKGPVAVDKLEEIARSCGVKADLMSQMLSTLHTWGVIVRFTRGERLYIIINPQWLHDRFAEVVTVQTVARTLLDARHGIVKEETLRKLPGWAELTSEQQTDVLVLLQEYEIMLHAYQEQVDGVHQQRWLVPALLPASRPDSFREALKAPLAADDAQRVYRVHLSFLPEGLFSLLTVRLRGMCAAHDHDSVQLLYRTGIVVTDRRTGSHGFVYAKETFLYVDVRGRSPWALGQDVLDTLEHLVAERFKGLTLELWVHCISDKCPPVADEAVTQTCFLSLKSVAVSLEMGKTAKECPKCVMDIDLSELLYGRVAVLEQGTKLTRENLLRNAQSAFIATISDESTTLSTRETTTLMQRIDDIVLVLQRLLLRGPSPTPRLLFLTGKNTKCKGVDQVDAVSRLESVFKRLVTDRFYLHVCCEFEGGAHCVREYKVRFNKKMVEKVKAKTKWVSDWIMPIAASAASTAVKTAATAYGGPVAGMAAGKAVDLVCDGASTLTDDDSKCHALHEAAGMLRDVDAGCVDFETNTREGVDTVDDREYEKMLLSLDAKDSDTTQWGLNKCVWRDGRTVFLCSKHTKECEASLLSTPNH